MSSNKYMCILRNQDGGCNDEPSSASDMEAMYAKYQKWQQQYAQNIVDKARIGLLAKICTR